MVFYFETNKKKCIKYVYTVSDPWYVKTVWDVKDCSLDFEEQ